MIASLDGVVVAPLPSGFVVRSGVSGEDIRVQTVLPGWAIRLIPGDRVRVFGGYGAPGEWASAWAQRRDANDQWVGVRINPDDKPDPLDKRSWPPSLVGPPPGVPNALARLAAHLAAHFPTADLSEPDALCIPFETEPHLRFELGEHMPSFTEARIAQAADRASAILESVIGPDAPIDLLIVDWRDPFRAGALDHLYDLVGPPGGDLTERAAGRQNDSFYTVALRMKRSALPHREMFTGIGNREMRLQPKVSQRVYIVHADKPIAFCMYDDRGADLFGDAATLNTAREQCKDWLVQ